MARRTNLRYLIEGTVRCTTPLHVGGLGGDPDADLQLARDGQHRYYVPGTSLAGALRSWAYHRAARDAVEALFGFQRERSDAGAASRLVIEDAPIENATPEIREGVGINRVTGAAAEHILYDRAVLPAGTSFPLRLAFEAERADDPASALLSDIIEALQGGWIALGAGVTRGYGRIRLDNLDIRRENLATRDGMIAALLGEADEVALDELRAGTTWRPEPAPRLRFIVDMRSDGPVMVRSGTDGLAVDAMPLVTTIGGKTTLVLSGSSVKGALRSTAERIVRTIMGSAAKAGLGTSFADQLALPLVEDVFGAPARRSTHKKDTLGRGALSVLDTHARWRIPVEQWQQIEQAKDAVACRDAAVRAGLEELHVAYHVSVDRWTGGAVAGRLFSGIEPLDTEWEPLVLELDLVRLGWPEDDETPRQAIALLSLVLHELSCGRLPLGFAVNRGMGGVSVDRIRVEGWGLEGTPFAALAGLVAEHGFRTIPGPILDEVSDSWLEWCDFMTRQEAAHE